MIQQIPNFSTMELSVTNQNVKNNSLLEDLIKRMEHIGSKLDSVIDETSIKLSPFLDGERPMANGAIKQDSPYVPPFYTEANQTLDTLEEKISTIQDILGRVRT